MTCSTISRLRMHERPGSRRSHGTSHLGSTGDADLPRYAVCVVAAARRERARRRRGGRASRARPRGDRARALHPRGRSARGPAGRPRTRATCSASSPSGRRWFVWRRSQMGVPVGVRANLRLALAQGGFDLVHGFEPGLPSLSYLALRETDALTVATFCSIDRLGYPPARSQREKLLARIDALLALSEPIRVAAAERFPGDYTLTSPGVSLERFAPGSKRNRIVVELRPNERAAARGVLHALRELPDWEAMLVRTTPLVARPAIPRHLAGRASAQHRPRRPRQGCPARGDRDLRSGKRRRGAAAARSPGGRLRSRDASRRGRAAGSLPPPPRHGSPRIRRFEPRLSARQRRPRGDSRSTLWPPASTSSTVRSPSGDAPPRSPRPPIRSRTGRGSSPTCTWLRLGHSDCTVDPAELVDHVIAEGIGAHRRDRPQHLRRRPRDRGRGGRPRADRDPG